MKRRKPQAKNPSPLAPKGKPPKQVQFELFGPGEMKSKAKGNPYAGR
jgi:hypothetical protein